MIALSARGRSGPSSESDADWSLTDTCRLVLLPAGYKKSNADLANKNKS